MVNIVIFASGSGSNAENIVQYFEQGKHVKVSAVYTNNANAGVIERMKKYGIPCIIFSKADLYNKDYFTMLLYQQQPQFIILAGFLLLMPPYLVRDYPHRIINIHPSLLPKFGGKGMYGMHVHKAVKESNELVTGISIHEVNEIFDEGTIIFQSKTELSPSDTPESIAEKVHELEMKHFPRIIHLCVKNYIAQNGYKK